MHGNEYTLLFVPVVSAVGDCWSVCYSPSPSTVDGGKDAVGNSGKLDHPDTAEEINH